MIIVRKDDDKRLEKRETISRGETSARDKEHRDPVIERIDLCKPVEAVNPLKVMTVKNLALCSSRDQKEG